MKNNTQKNIASLIVLSAFVLLLVASATTKEVPVKKDFKGYEVVSVPAEGGIKFTQITKEDESSALGRPEIIRELPRKPNEAELNSGLSKEELAELTKRLNNGAVFCSTHSDLVVSKDGKELYYCQMKDNNKNIYSRKTIGASSITQISFRNASHMIGYAPINDNQIVFSDDAEDNYNIYKKSIIGAAVQQIAGSSSGEFGPVISPDEKFIFFSKTQGDKSYVWSCELSNSSFVQYTSGIITSFLDKDQILVVRRNIKTNKDEIWVINLVNGSESLLLGASDKSFTTPKISPDGKKILLTGTTPKSKNTNTNLDLYLMNVDGSNLTQITFHPGHDYSATWAADGQSIYFLSQRGNGKGNYGIWALNLSK